MTTSAARTTNNAERHPGEAIEEKIAPVRRFGLWISLYPFRPPLIQAIVRSMAAPFRASTTRRPRRAVRFAVWALERGSRSGRVPTMCRARCAGRLAATVRRMICGPVSEGDLRAHTESSASRTRRSLRRRPVPGVAVGVLVAPEVASFYLSPRGTVYAGTGVSGGKLEPAKTLIGAAGGECCTRRSASPSGHAPGTC